MNQPGVNNDYLPWDDINEKDELPGGVFHMKVIHAEEGVSNTTGKRMIRVGFQVMGPQECIGGSHFENYVVGTDEAPTAFVAGTMGARGLKKLWIAAQVPQSASVAQMLAGTLNAELLTSVSYKPDADFKNNITNYFRLGERPIGVTVPLKPSVAGPMGSGAGAVSPPGGAPPVATPVSAPPVQAPPVQAQPVQQPPVAPPIAPAPAAAPAIPPAAAPAAVAGETATCTICNANVPVAEFGAHIQAHAAQM